jgi:4-aminobutyrate aminotransferase-like enzyme
MLGIPDTGHDHATVFTNITSDFTSLGYTTSKYVNSNRTETFVKSLITTTNNKVFVSRSHGNYQYAYNGGNVQIGTYLYLYNTSTSTGDKLSSYSSFTSMTISNMKLMVFVGCYTGKGGTNGANLPHVAVSHGANAAIGFSTTLVCSAANTWTKDYFDSLSSGYTVSQAYTISMNYGSMSYSGTGLENGVICGNSNTYL